MYFSAKAELLSFNFHFVAESLICPFVNYENISFSDTPVDSYSTSFNFAQWNGSVTSNTLVYNQAIDLQGYSEAEIVLSDVEIYVRLDAMESARADLCKFYIMLYKSTMAGVPESMFDLAHESVEYDISNGFEQTFTIPGFSYRYNDFSTNCSIQFWLVVNITTSYMAMINSGMSSADISVKLYR